MDVLPQPASSAAPSTGSQVPSSSSAAAAPRPRRNRRGGGGGGGGGGNARPPPLSAAAAPRSVASSGAPPPAAAPGGAGARRRANFGGQLSAPVGGEAGGAPSPAAHAPSSAANPQGASSTAGPRADGAEGVRKRTRNRGKKDSSAGADTLAGAGTSTPALSTTTTGSRPPKQRKNGAPINPSVPRAPPPPAPSDDAPLSARLTHALSHAPYADCSICFNAIHPAQPTWSCTPAPSTGDVGVKDGELKEGTSCWGVFHLKCIKEWAEGSIKGGEGGWRCPGCQTKRLQPPRQYLCFCTSTVSPQPPRLATPHSCASPCSRPRAACTHPCPLDCHPGPCPPCRVELHVACGSHGTDRLVRCGAEGAGCGEVCGRQLGCERDGHVCLERCHDGPCLPCPVEEVLTCFCGEHTRIGTCNELLASSAQCAALVPPSATGGLTTWEGRYSCGSPCPQPFACGVHPCALTCHPHSLADPPVCPRDPDRVTHCPCGKRFLDELPGGKDRERCTDPVKTCGGVCGRERGCGHACGAACHEGSCRPCEEEVVIPCRCGETKVRRLCWQRQDEEERGESEVRCEIKCTALRSCRRHQCGRVCCPLVYKARTKGKRRAVDEYMLAGTEDDEGEWHTCQLVCGKTLPCGNHTCPALDHKGPCPPCLEASYEELICHCTRTVILPPIACGKTFNCTYPCVRPAPTCGHPKVQHACHEDARCPPCVFLTEKTCACGKHTVKNVRCSQAKVSCGTACGELLACGWHRCEKTCHLPGECERCEKPCGKPRRYCGHPCQQPCHSPASCDLTLPCAALVTQRCACGRREQQAVCTASTASPSSKASTVLKCSDECHKAERNARLAAALGISPARADRGGASSVEWPQELQERGFALGSAFVGLVEKSVGEFVQGPRATQILPHMPLVRREFVTKLAEVYRVDTSLVDQEPSRSVQLRRRVDSRVPSPLLSAVISASQAPASRTRLNTSRPVAPGSSSAGAAPAWGATAVVPGSSGGVAAPSPRPWGNVPTPQTASASTSARPSPAASRSASPYVPPGLRNAAAPIAGVGVNAGVQQQQQQHVQAVEAASSALAGVQLNEVKPSAAPVLQEGEKDDTWEQSDNEDA